MKMAALIPARGGSKRIPGKNLLPLGGYPLLRYAVASAQQSQRFSEIVVSSEDDTTLRLAHEWGARAIWCPLEVAHRDDTPDIYWVRHALERVTCDTFAILRPTNPFRTPWMIQRAYRQFTLPDQTADTLRAVEPVTQHPAKMWQQVYGPVGPIKPLIEGTHDDGTPWHSSPTQTLPVYYVQNASLEMTWAYVVREYGTITGRKIAPFFTEGYEGFDLNTMADWREAEYLIASRQACLPEIHVAA
jgi:CMP-N,N'-diacetyllegionaminic acid synthase